MPGLSSDQKKQRLSKISYTDFLLNTVGIDPQAMWFFKDSGNSSFVVGADALPALFADNQEIPGFLAWI